MGLTLLLLAALPAQPDQGIPRPAIAIYEGCLRTARDARGEPHYELHAGHRVYALAFDPSDNTEADAARLVGGEVRVCGRGTYRLGTLDVLLVIWLDGWVGVEP